MQLGEEAQRTAELLDVTPTLARRLLLLREKDKKTPRGVVVLNPDVFVERRIIDAFGWKDTGQGGMGDRESQIVLPPRLPLVPASPIPVPPELK